MVFFFFFFFFFFFYEPSRRNFLIFHFRGSPETKPTRKVWWVLTVPSCSTTFRDPGEPKKSPESCLFVDISWPSWTPIVKRKTSRISWKPSFFSRFSLPPKSPSFSGPSQSQHSWHSCTASVRRLLESADGID